MKAILIFALFTAISVTMNTVLMAQTKIPGELPAAFNDAWNSHDPAKFDKIFADDVAFLPYPQVLVTDRKAVIEGFGQLVTKEWAKDVNTKLFGNVTVQKLGPSTASVFFNSQLVDRKTGKEVDPDAERATIFVAVKGKIGWRIASMQLTKENPDAPLSANDESEIKKLIMSVQDAMNAPDLNTYKKAYSELFTDNTDWINSVGMYWQGKKNVLLAHETYFDTAFKNGGWFFTDMTIRQIGFHSAVVVVTEHTTKETHTPSGDTVQPGGKTKLSFVVVKQNGKWLISHGHNTPINQQAKPFDPIAGGWRPK